MGKTKDLIPLKELNLTNRFLFDEVLEDPQTHQDILSIIFGRDIPLLEQNETEKELRVSPHLRAVRMDVYAMDEEKSVYNTEMQQKKRTDLAKRSRYYQSMIDAGLLEPGIPDYNQLNNSYIIIITPFDLFGYGRYVYTFRAGCLEEPECCLEDGAVRIFLNTRGKNDGEVSKELVGFLRYVEDTTDEMAADMDSERIKRIHNRVRKVKASEEVGVKYMQAWEERYYDKEEARQEGLEEGRQEGLEEGRQEGLEEGRQEGREIGKQEAIKNLIRKKLKKGCSAEEIADILEEEQSMIQGLIDEIEKENL
ncbi:Rpn family recombination-promoting nuclease/putative transposase [[Clostridium] scindens]|uniref:Rpn family recombination-promoting nuclease/putative transposase n=2 Tax=Clostridium scindens (strain JCM 10418 / VPI 12708) TaxID=29347 RepID=UPI001D05CE90|nr:Rpn family recombination-promoting nuclease/putative transposase [[Clostridium] scindens]MCB6647137.1 Rpn family recombination-promoting nuclease/putative transposase [[Clostridium] scindens]